MINWPYPFDYESLAPCTDHNCPGRKMIQNRAHNYLHNFDRKRPRQSLDHFVDDLLPIDVHRDEPKLSEFDLNLGQKRRDQVSITDDSFIIKCPIGDFEPEELSVKTLDNFLILEGRHEMKSSKFHTSRTFSHKWSIPEGVQVDQMKCHVNSRTGELRLEAPRHLCTLLEDKMAEKEIPVKIEDKKQKSIAKESEMEKMLDFA